MMAYPRPQRHFPGYFVEHRDTYFNPEVIRVGETPVHVLHNLDGWAVNSVVIEGDTGLIVFDTGASLQHGKAIAREVRRLSSKPVRAVVYSHHHADHCSGTTALVDPAHVRSGAVTVIASDLWAREHATEDSVVGPITGVRAAFQYAAFLPPEEDTYAGLGRRFLGEDRSELVHPNRTVSGEEETEIAGVRLRFFPTAGEAGSEIGVHLPDFRVAIIADEVYAALANLHTPRGARFRDAEQWANATQRVLSLNIDFLVGTHMPPIHGAGEIRRVLTTYQDAIQFNHDQAVRLLLSGADAEELRTRVTALPAQLDLAPYTRPMYGTVAGNAAEQFTGYLGWFSGHAVDLAPTPRPERARRTIELMGGRDRVVAAASRAMAAGDPQWAAELARLLLDANRDDSCGRPLMADALRARGYDELNPLWRNWYLTAAMEVEGSIDLTGARDRIEARIARSARALLDGLRFRVDPDAAGDTHETIGVEVSDTGEHFGLSLRNSVLRVSEGIPTTWSGGMKLDHDRLAELALGARTLDDLVRTGDADVTGDTEAVARVWASLAPRPPVSLHLR